LAGLHVLLAEAVDDLLALAILEVVFELAGVDDALVGLHVSLAVTLAVLELSFVGIAILLFAQDELSHTVGTEVADMPCVAGLVHPREDDHVVLLPCVGSNLPS
jgi:hypothetical protein